MKTVGTITEILDLFYKRIDDVSIHTKHTVANGKYGYELKDGILYCRGKQIGVCNKYLPFVVRLHDIEDYLYRPLVKLKNQKIRGKIMDVIIICNRIGISLEEYKVTRKQLLSQFEKRQEV